MKKNITGIAFCAVIAGFAMFLSSLKLGSFSLDLIGAPVFSIVFGMLITLAFPKFAVDKRIASGIQFTSKKILQYAVILLGFSLNLGTIAKVGGKSLPVIIATISVSLIVAMVLMKVLKMDKKVSCLIGVGSSICGGSAIAATSTVIDADDNQITQSMSVIFLFNVLAALIFPTMGHAIGLGSEGFAVFAGTAVNDTSSVTAAASTAENIYGCEGILSVAVTVKLTRTLAIIPITLILAFIRANNAKKNGNDSSEKVSIKNIFPFFILFFIGASLITTLVGITGENAFSSFYNEHFVSVMKWLAKYFIAMAMCAVGLKTDIIKLVKNGAKPIFMGLCCWVSITVVSIAVQYVTGIFYTNI